ncbi:hypothetical protein CAC42_2444 [Sphaceloma murrayae]|uniref:Uncharacterized protein n=1 Tax=Sphaceloma murrayae TaxID=2082308 RepID=A0A2K1QW31_9PEZI|nr:hypothetical protein CAC42_2444 [Sphaceloma murrayae]
MLALKNHVLHRVWQLELLNDLFGGPTNTELLEDMTVSFAGLKIESNTSMPVRLNPEKDPREPPARYEVYPDRFYTSHIRSPQIVYHVEVTHFIRGVESDVSVREYVVDVQRLQVSISRVSVWHKTTPALVKALEIFGASTRSRGVHTNTTWEQFLQDTEDDKFAVESRREQA